MRGHCLLYGVNNSFQRCHEEAFEGKKLNYAGPVAEASEQGWHAHTRQVEIGVTGFVAKINHVASAGFWFSRMDTQSSFKGVVRGC